MPQPASKRFVMEDKFTTDLALKAPIASPTFTGTVTAGAGGITVPSGNITLTSGNITASAGTITANTVAGASVNSTGNVGADYEVAAGTRLRSYGDILAETRILSNSATAITNSSTAHAVQAGPGTGLNVRLGNDGTNAAVQAVNNGAYSALNVNSLGGTVNVGSSSTTSNILGTVNVGSAGTTTTAVGGLVTATGNGTLAPLKIPAGTLMGTPTEDVIEADADAFYGTTNATHGRGVIQTMLFSSGTPTFVSTASAQNVFPVPNDTLAMAANTTYMVEGLIHISVPATSSAAHTMSFTLNGGTATTTAQVMAFATQNNTSATAIPTVAASYLLTATTASTIWATASTAATAVFRTVHFKGIVRCAAAGTFIPRITTSVASVAIPAGTTNNYITLTPIGSNTVAAVGAWT